MNLRPLVGLFFSRVITTVFLAIALYSVDFPKLINSPVRADYRLIFLAAALTVCGYVLRTVRSRRLPASTKVIALARLSPVLVVGFALNNLLHGRHGELARPYWLGRREGLSRPLGFGTIVVEREGLLLFQSRVKDETN